MSSADKIWILVSLLKKLAEWEFDIYKSAYTNQPDLVIKLMVPTEIAIQRKPEMTFEEIENALGHKVIIKWETTKQILTTHVKKICPW